MATGDSGTLLIEDYGANVGLYIRSDDEGEIIEQLPWTYTLNGVTESWKSHYFNSDYGWNHLGTIWVGYSQTITLRLGDTGSYDLGGPTDFPVVIHRGSAGTGARVRYGTEQRPAQAWVNVNGVWTPAELWVKHAGVWKQTT